MGKFAKDPNRPKAPLTAFFAWAKTARAKITAANPGAGLGQIGKLLGSTYNALSDAEKAPFKDAYSAARETFNVEFAEYKATPGYAEYEAARKVYNRANNNKKALKKLKKACVGAPKRPMSAYFQYVNANRASVDAPFLEITKILATRWSALSDAEKQPYQDQAAADKAEYQAAFAEYQLTDEYKNYKEAVKAARKDTPERRAKAKAKATAVKEKAKAEKAKAKAKAAAVRAKANAKKAKATASRKKKAGKAKEKRARATAKKKAAVGKRKATAAKKRARKSAAIAKKKASAAKKRERKAAGKAKKSAQREKKRAAKRARSEKKKASKAAGRARKKSKK